MNDFLLNTVYFELGDAVGRENVSIRTADKLSHSMDYFWLPRMYVDRGEFPPEADFVVYPGSAQEVSKVLVIANYYKIPVYTWGGGSGSQGGALPVKGGIILDTKRMNKVIDFDERSMTVTVEAGMIFGRLEWYANERGYSLMHYPSLSELRHCRRLLGPQRHRRPRVPSTER